MHAKLMLEYSSEIERCDVMARDVYTINLSDEERFRLEQIVNSDIETDRAKIRAQILLFSDQSSKNEKYTVLELAEVLGTTHTTIMVTRATYAECGLEAAVFRKKRTVLADKRKLNPTVVEQILKLKCENPPNGKKTWSLRLLCEECMRRGIVDKISPASMMKLLKENEQ